MAILADEAWVTKPDKYGPHKVQQIVTKTQKATLSGFQGYSWTDLMNSMAQRGARHSDGGAPVFALQSNIIEAAWQHVTDFPTLASFIAHGIDTYRHDAFLSACTRTFMREFRRRRALAPANAGAGAGAGGDDVTLGMLKQLARFPQTARTLNAPHMGTRPCPITEHDVKDLLDAITPDHFKDGTADDLEHLIIMFNVFVRMMTPEDALPRLEEPALRQRLKDLVRANMPSRRLLWPISLQILCNPTSLTSLGFDQDDDDTAFVMEVALFTMYSVDHTAFLKQKVETDPTADTAWRIIQYVLTQVGKGNEHKPNHGLELDQINAIHWAALWAIVMAKVREAPVPPAILADLLAGDTWSTLVSSSAVPGVLTLVWPHQLPNVQKAALVDVVVRLGAAVATRAQDRYRQFYTMEGLCSSLTFIVKAMGRDAVNAWYSDVATCPLPETRRARWAWRTQWTDQDPWGQRAATGHVP